MIWVENRLVVNPVRSKAGPMASNPTDEINFDGKEVSFKRPGNGRTLTLIFADGELRGDLSTQQADIPLAFKKVE